MQPVLELMAQLDLLTWDEALEINAHLVSLETFDLLGRSLQRKVWLAQALLNWDPQEDGVTVH